MSLLAKLKSKTRAGYIFLPTSNKREPVGVFELDLPKGLNIDAFSTKRFEFGVGLTKDLSKKLSGGVTVLKDEAGKTQAGFLLTWRF